MKLSENEEYFCLPYIEYSELSLVNKISLDNKISNIFINSYITFFRCIFDIYLKKNHKQKYL